ncbi:hypothetical protein G7Y79_00022g053040 [Physcia stellaris]|nr:hypothetical protein G7Y79_00022g053040 [Physcia stellaris]
MSPPPSARTALLRTPSNGSTRRTYTSFPAPSISSSTSLTTISQTTISKLLLALPYICIPSALMFTIYLLKTPAPALPPSSTPPPALSSTAARKPILCALPALAVFWLVVHIFEPVEERILRAEWIKDRMRKNFRNCCAFSAGVLCAVAVGLAL